MNSRALSDPPKPLPSRNPGLGQPRRRRGRSSLLARGEPMVWLTGGALAVCVIMILGLLCLIVRQGIDTFWPLAVVQIETVDGATRLGEVTRTAQFDLTPGAVESLTDEKLQAAAARLVENGEPASVRRRLVRTGNFELTSTHFHWVEDYAVDDESAPAWALIFERTEWGRFYGFPKAFLIDGEPVAETPETTWEQFNLHHQRIRNEWLRRQSLERLAGVNDDHRDGDRLVLREVELEYGLDSPEYKASQEAYNAQDEKAQQEFQRIRQQINSINQANGRYQMLVATSTGEEKQLRLDEIVRAYPANQLTTAEKLAIYGSRWWEFLTDVPRQANSEGGVAPAIWGTVTMTLIMSFAVVPFGVLAALYLREYSNAGPVVSAVRIAINNLAGVPSIVFGVFGLGFFCYFLGGFVDSGPTKPLPPPIWYLVVAAGAVTAVGGFLFWIQGGGRNEVTGWRRWCRGIAMAVWLVSTIFVATAIFTSPYFDGLYRARLPNPTFGKSGLLWASLTLALLTLPVVIVATEEALAAVPSSMREGSYACGASKWQTIKRIVLPRAMPGIMTGTILAMARGAGEVAPLMLVGAVKFSRKMPVDGDFPFVHLERSFMHLGFHIFDLGFQSQNSEAARPMVYTTTLLLILIIATLNLAAIWLRSRLRRKFVTAQF